MSYQAYSHLIFGFKAPRSTVNQSDAVRGCNHSITQGMKFCPECGASVYIQKQSRILNSFKYDKLSYFFSDHEGNEDIVIGFSLGKTDYNTMSTPVSCKSPTPEMKDEILQFITEHNLNYSEKHIKMYVMTYHSY